MNEAMESYGAEADGSTAEASPLEQARLAALEYFRRVYMIGSSHATLETLKDFTFEPRGPHRINASIRRASSEVGTSRARGSMVFWCALRLDSTDTAPRIVIDGRTERIDAIVLMLSYLAICNQRALDYFHPVLQQRIHAEPDGALTLNG